MRTIKTTAIIALSALALMIPVTSLRSQEKKPTLPSVESQAKPQVSTVVAPLYRPPLRGAPGGRVGGGTRGAEREMFVLSVLAPDHTGLTISEQPSLYWFISSLSSSPIEVTVVDPHASQPALETRIAPPIQPGVHQIRLADHGVRLASGVAYRWYVAVVPDVGRRSKDILAGGTIERVQRPESLVAKLAHVGPAELPSLYAEAGLWYDALGAISELIDGAPNDLALRKQRAAMAAQVGLPEINE